MSLAVAIHHYLPLIVLCYSFRCRRDPKFLLSTQTQNSPPLVPGALHMPAARTTRASAGARNFACGANYLAPGWFNFACGANYPHQALKGGYFVFVWRVGTRLGFLENCSALAYRRSRWGTRSSSSLSGATGASREPHRWISSGRWVVS